MTTTTKTAAREMLDLDRALAIASDRCVWLNGDAYAKEAAKIADILDRAEALFKANPDLPTQYRCGRALTKAGRI